MNKTVQDMEKEIESIKSGVNSEKKIISNRSYRGKLQEQNTRGGRENFRH